MHFAARPPDSAFLLDLEKPPLWPSPRASGLCLAVLHLHNTRCRVAGPSIEAAGNLSDMTAAFSMRVAMDGRLLMIELNQ